MIRVIRMMESGDINPVEVEQIKTILQDTGDFIWIDIAAEQPEICKPILQEIFNFHPLAIDDALHETHVPKVDDWNDYLYLVLRTALRESPQTEGIAIPELDIFLGENYLVSYQSIPIQSVEKIWELCQKDQRYLSRGAGFLLYQIADEMATDIMHLIEEIDEHVDQIEDEIFTDPQSATLAKIFSIKRTVLKLRRTLLPQKEVFNKLARGDFALIKTNDQVYFRDLYDHMVRLQEINESTRDLLSGALDTYLSVINNRMNEIMKVLTIIATIFIPLSFFTSIYGMNFAYMPELQWRWGYFLILSFLAIIFFAMLIFFKQKKWF
ncbi:MAG: magnesium/cobalt transporter CorA [Chloroflexota bacterium]|nr:MAG: magnesium/cobalt transporter CorA [Chloroflexota bacterium]